MSRRSRPRPRLHPGDVIAGMSVAVVSIPLSLAYASLAGMPPVSGLYASALPPLAAAIFASSPYLQTGPVAITALLTFGALSSVATPGTDEYAALGLGLALIVGVVRVVLGLARAGWVAYLMSQPMLIGFVPAAAVLIAASQLPKALGVRGSPDYDNDILEAVWAAAHPGDWGAAALVAAGLTLLVVLAGRRLHALFPGVLLCAVVATAVSALGGYSGPTVEHVPAGLPPFTAGDVRFGEFAHLLVAGVVIALVGFTEAASISRRFASEDRTTWSANREFVSQGVANVVAAGSGGMPCGGSFTRSSVSRLSGGRTRVAGAVAGLTVLAFLPFAGVLSPLPLAVLGAIVISAVCGLLRFRPLIALWRLSVPQACIAWATFLGTLGLAPRIDRAVLLGIGLSIFVFLWRALQLDIDVTAKAQVLTFAPRGVLWFGTAQKLDEALIRALAEHPDARVLEIDLIRLGRIDTTGALVLRGVLDEARAAGLEARARNLPPQSAQLTGRILAGERSPLA